MGSDTDFLLGYDHLSPSVLRDAVDRRPTLSLSDRVLDRLKSAHHVVRQASLQRLPVYGLTTGVGAQARAPVEQAERAVAIFNRRLVLDHAGGIGPDLPEPVCYAVALVRLHNLALGGSGIGPAVLAHAVALLNAGVVPVIPQAGSVGASDLSACAALASAWCLGEGRVYYDKRSRPAADVLHELGLGEVDLLGKDGLSLLSANSLSLGYGALLSDLLLGVLDVHLQGVALSFEAYGANLSVLAPEIHRLRPYSRQGEMAARLRALLKDSYLWEELAARNLQDPLSFRCTPQVLGALYERIERLWQFLDADLNALSDNPVILIEKAEIVPTGNFDTTSLSLDVDAVSQGIVRAILMCERRIDKLLSSSFSSLPTGLSNHPTAHGYTILSHTSASLAAEALSVSLGGIPQIAPIEEGVEDVGSMAPVALARLQRLTDMMLTMTAIETLVASRAGRLLARRPIAGIRLIQRVEECIQGQNTPGSQAYAVRETLLQALPRDFLVSVV